MKHFILNSLQYWKSVNLSDITDTSNLKLILELIQRRCQNLTKITYNKGGLRPTSLYYYVAQLGNFSWIGFGPLATSWMIIVSQFLRQNRNFTYVVFS